MWLPTATKINQTNENVKKNMFARKVGSSIKEVHLVKINHSFKGGSDFNSINITM
jgi:hypothetical protein